MNTRGFIAILVIVALAVVVLLWLGVLPVRADHTAGIVDPLVGEWHIVVSFGGDTEATMRLTGTLAECEAYRALLKGYHIGPCKLVEGSATVAIPPPAEMTPVQASVPPVPAREPDADQLHRCDQNGTGFRTRIWQDEKYAQYLPVIEGKTGSVIVTLIFDDVNADEPSAVYISLPKQPVERVTAAQLHERWPGACMMVQAVMGART